MLTLTFLGVGSAFAKRNFQSNALLEAWSGGPNLQPSPDETMLIDFGATGPMALYQLKDRPGFAYLNRKGSLHYPAVGGVFVTHTHSDHIGGLEEFASVTLFSHSASQAIRPKLWAAPEVADNLWEMSLRGGLGVLDGRAARLDDYFGVQRLPRRSEGSNESFSLLGRYRLTPFPTDHVRVARKFDWPSYGLALEDASTGRKAVYSGDTRFDPERMVPLLSGAHWTFHEVQLEAEPNPLHTSLAELRTLPAELRRRMLLYHYGDSWDAPGYDFVAQEFAGFARPQFRYVLFE